MTKLEVKKLIKEAVSEGRKALLEPEAMALISAWGIPVPKTAFIEWSRERVVGTGDISPPYVLKVVSPDILHKSDVGGVIRGIRYAEEVGRAVARIERNISEKAPKARIEGFLLEEMAPRGLEVIIGGLRDLQFGPAVMFGIGGIAVELMRDISYRLAPFDKDEALNMMKEVRTYPLLAGFRGSRQVDMNRVASVIVKVSEMLLEIEEIKGIEINPLLAYEDGVMAVDARVVLK